MTYKNAKILLFGIVMMTMMFAGDAYAHPSPSIMTYGQFDANDGTQRIWYDVSALNFVTVDGQENRGSQLAAMIDWSRNVLNTLSDMTVTQTSTWVSGDSLAQATFNSSTNVYGWTTIIGDGTARYKIIMFNTNNGLNYLTAASCTNSLDRPNPQYIANHEMGHFAGLNHHGLASSTHTAMMSGCNPGQAAIRQADIDDINSWYS